MLCCDQLADASAATLTHCSPPRSYGTNDHEAPTNAQYATRGMHHGVNGYSLLHQIDQLLNIAHRHNLHIAHLCSVTWGIIKRHNRPHKALLLGLIQAL